MRGKGTKLGEGCPKVRLSQDRMPILGKGAQRLGCQDRRLIRDFYVNPTK